MINAESEIQKGINISYELPNNVLESIPNPLVSVRISTYQHVGFIRQCLDGVLAQKTDFDYEIIVGEDCSNDGTREIVFEYAKKYPEIIRVITADINVGAKINGIRCIKKNRGKYSAICEGDDIWNDENKLAYQINFLENNPEYVGCFTNYGTIDEFGDVLKESNLGTDFKSYNQLDILSRKTPKTLTVLYRMSAMPKEMPDSFFKVKNGDLFISALLSKQGNYAYLARVTGYYREHSGGIWSLTGDKSRYHNQVKTSLRMMDHFNSMEQIDALRYRLKNACSKLKEIYKKEGNSKMIIWCNWVLLKSIFEYSFKELIHKLMTRI